MSEDAKLSTAARKKLPASAFCGPDRSFPAHDCAHVRAGFRLLSRYKGPGSKSKIRSCLERKNKSMDCGVESSKDGKDNLKNYFESLSKTDLQKIDEIVDSEEFEGSKELMDFMDATFKDYTVAGEDVEKVRDSAANLLDSLRRKRLDTQDSKVEEYKERGISVLMDNLSDEICRINTEE